MTDGMAMQRSSFGTALWKWLSEAAPLSPSVREQAGTGPLDTATLRDIGLRSDFRDYAASTGLSSDSQRRLHSLAERAGCGLP